jgi:hypothetical protein
MDLTDKRPASWEGGDVFWATTEFDTAKLFAQVNPKMSSEFGVVGIQLPGGIAAAEQAGIIALDQSGAYVVRDWAAFNRLAQFYKGWGTK